MDRWVGCLPVGLGVKRGGSEKVREVDNLLGYLTAGGKSLLLCESGIIVPLLTNAAEGGGD